MGHYIHTCILQMYTSRDCPVYDINNCSAEHTRTLHLWFFGFHSLRPFLPCAHVTANLYTTPAMVCNRSINIQHLFSCDAHSPPERLLTNILILHNALLMLAYCTESLQFSAFINVCAGLWHSKHDKIVKGGSNMSESSVKSTKVRLHLRVVFKGHIASESRVQKYKGQGASESKYKGHVAFQSSV